MSTTRRGLIGALAGLGMFALGRKALAAYPPTNALTAVPTWMTEPAELTFADGQSRAANNSADGSCTTVALLDTPLEPNICLMMNNRAKPGCTFEAPFNLTDATNLINFADGVGCPTSQGPIGQSLGSLMYRKQAYDVAGARPIVRQHYIACGLGGQPLSTMMKGAAPFVGSGGTFVKYQRTINLLTRAIQLHNNLHNQVLLIPRVFIAEGEADLTSSPQTSYSVCYAYFTQWWSDLRADIAALVAAQAGSPVNPPVDFFLDITPGVPQGAGTAPNSAGIGGPVMQVQMDFTLANADGHTWCVGTASERAFGNGVEHMLKEHVVLHDEKIAWAMEQVKQGKPVVVPRMTSLQVVGNSIVGTVSGLLGDLVIDATVLPAATGTHSSSHETFYLGFRYVDSANNSITGVTVSGNQFTVDLSGAPQPGWLLQYAWDGMGATINFTDPWSGRTDAYGAASFGNLRDGGFEVPSQFITIANGYPANAIIYMSLLPFNYQST